MAYNGDSMDQGLMEPLLSFAGGSMEPEEGISYLLEYPSIDVSFLNIQGETWFNKFQCRRGGETKMRVENGEVHMVAVSTIQIETIKVWVFREPTAAEECGDTQGKVELPVHMGELGVGKQNFSVNLDDVYQGPCRPVYELAKVDMKRRNAFQLSVVLYFIDGSSSQEFFSKPFFMRTKPKLKTGKESTATKEPVTKRRREGSGGSGDSLFFPYESSPGDSAVSSPEKSCHGEFHSLRVLDQLEASRAKIDHLTFSVWEPAVGKADLAYQFRLSDPEVCGQYNEGDVVAFCEGDKGQTEIELLTSQNIGSTYLAGVVSRSAYLKAKPGDLGNDKTDVVCVIGVVKVKCIGTVKAGERIYASIDSRHAGIAIPESYLPVNAILTKENNMLGMAMETSKAADPFATHLVKCFVCIVMGVQSQQISMEIENLYENFEMDLMVKLKKERQRMRKVVFRVVSALVILLGLLGVLLFQVFYPGSAFRYWMCNRGSIPGSKAQFKFIPNGDINQRITVNGVEFTFKELKEKVADGNVITPMRDKTVFPVHYYLNIDRCAYGGIHLGGSVFGAKQVGGPKVFAINQNCTRVFYFRTPPHGGWIQYKSVAKYFKNQTRCSFKT